MNITTHKGYHYFGNGEWRNVYVRGIDNDYNDPWRQYAYIPEDTEEPTPDDYVVDYITIRCPDKTRGGMELIPIERILRDNHCRAEVFMENGQPHVIEYFRFVEFKSDEYTSVGIELSDDNKEYRIWYQE